MERKEDTGCGILWKRFTIRNERVILEGICAVKMPKGIRLEDLKKLQIRIRNREEDPGISRFGWAKGLPFMKGYRLHTFSWEIPLADALELDIQNKFDVYYDGEWIGDFNYDIFSRREGNYRNTRPLRREGRTLFFRQTVHNKIWFVVREENIYDRPWHRFRVFCAWALAKILGRSRDILMYEKEAGRYEESASVLYERLIDTGHSNARYVLNRDNPAWNRLKPEYQRNLVAKDSFRHLLLYFRTVKFVGTETMDHALQLRAANRHIMEKTRREDIAYVFLQHGVMYMISLDADMRTGFTSRKDRLYRVVVSSEAEAIHFMTLGGFPREELYVTGLAKFDRSFREEGADVIMIMPTWRRWETNEARQDFTGTGYYRMLEDMVEAVPEGLREKIVIMPHPLMRQLMEAEDTPLSRYLRPDLSHDEVLRKTRLLITDYSSIAYDAFYRGANVVFYWKDKEECMRHYGHAHLMINEYNVFGDVARGKADLAAAAAAGYTDTQRPEYVRKYERIVSFRDGRNTDRIIECMEKDGII